MCFLKVLICRNVGPGHMGAGWSYYRDAVGFLLCVGALNKFQCFPGVCPLARGAKAGIRLPLPMGLALAPTDQDCFSLAPPTALPAHTHTK